MSRYLGDDWVLPGLDESNRPFFTTGCLTLQRCQDCQHVQHPPEDVCEACQGFELGWFESAGAGSAESAIVVHHAVHPGLNDHVPYVVVLVSVDDAPGVMVTGNVVNRPPHEVEIGDRVRVTLEEAVDAATNETLKIPQWEVV